MVMLAADGRYGLRCVCVCVCVGACTVACTSIIFLTNIIEERKDAAW